MITFMMLFADDELGISQSSQTQWSLSCMQNEYVQNMTNGVFRPPATKQQATSHFQWKLEHEGTNLF